jgi:transposase
MADEKFFLNPVLAWQRRYEALRASFVDRLPAKAVADRYGYSPAYVHLLRHQFINDKLDFDEPAPEGKVNRRAVDTATRQKICSWREHRLSAGEILQLLSEDGIELSIRTIERVLAEEGYPRLPRRTRLKVGLTVQGARVPEVSQVLASRDSRTVDCDSAGVFLFAPFIERLDLPKVVDDAGLPGSQKIPALQYVLSFLAVKLIGTERFAHMSDHSFDAGLGLFAGLNVLPKCTAMSTYSYSLDAIHLQRLQAAFVRQANRIGLYDKAIVNLDFHTIPHFGDESVLQKHWAGARNKRMKGALTLFGQDAQSKLIMYTAADIQRTEADDQVLEFLSFWKKIHRGVNPMLIFDSKFTTYANLSRLDALGVKFITLRRRGKKLIQSLDAVGPWTQIHIAHAKRKYQNPRIYESTVELTGYNGALRQIAMRGNGHERPTFLISNDTDSPAERIVSDYARRWRVENAISEAVKFFNLNALSSPILTKVHFDVIMTMVADTLYSMLAGKLRGFEHCDAAKVNRHFVKGKGQVRFDGGRVTVNFPRRAHNPILRNAPWHRLPKKISWLGDAELELKFK